ncbi:hypothetical protein HALO32_02934 [Halomonas lysinitropha]|uniref:Uncharacterized protein n=1 Tax=Halomonas lysinitropha TaxID=2607506 RepID=A0A5K1I976_9GAMM|nr:hypothetical protein [Halomonas lysinitropha]VVZ96827.1 hypothetical protein HALO32_02934 [Halomonas lysinitropha]
MDGTLVCPSLVLEELCVLNKQHLDTFHPTASLSRRGQAKPSQTRQPILSGVRGAVTGQALLKPIPKALTTLECHADQISGLTNARLEGMTGLFQADRSRARGYLNEADSIAMIYLIGSSVGRLLDQGKST